MIYSPLNLLFVFAPIFFRRSIKRSPPDGLMPPKISFVTAFAVVDETDSVVMTNVVDGFSSMKNFYHTLFHYFSSSKIQILKNKIPKLFYRIKNVEIQYLAILLQSHLPWMGTIVQLQILLIEQDINQKVIWNKLYCKITLVFKKLFYLKCNAFIKR